MKQLLIVGGLILFSGLLSRFPAVLAQPVEPNGRLIKTPSTSYKLEIMINKKECEKYGIQINDVPALVEKHLEGRSSWRLSELREVKIKAIDGKTVIPLRDLATIDVIFDQTVEKPSSPSQK